MDLEQLYVSLSTLLLWGKNQIIYLSVRTIEIRIMNFFQN